MYKYIGDMILATLQRIGDMALCPLKGERIRIGRNEDNEIIIDDDSVSAHHAFIEICDSNADEGFEEYTRKSENTDDEFKDYIIEDLGSTNKTFVNNVEIKRKLLYDGDIIRLGNTRLKFSAKEYTPQETKFEETRLLSGGKLESFWFKNNS